MDRAVLITGASRGIGAAVARRFAREGWRVGVNYRTSRGRAEALAAEIAAAGGQTALLPGDVSDPAQAAALVRAAEEQLGPLDALVCNAGVALPQQLLTDTTDEQWRQVMGCCTAANDRNGRIGQNGILTLKIDYKNVQRAKEPLRSLQIRTSFIFYGFVYMILIPDGFQFVEGLLNLFVTSHADLHN